MKLKLLGFFLLLICSGKAQSTCQAGFTYTINSNGQVAFADSSSGTTANTIYSWSFADGYTSTQQNPGTYTYVYNGSYLVNLTTTDSVAGCSSSFSKWVDITNATPCNLQASYTYTLGANGNVTFSNTTTGANAYTKYQWLFNGVNDTVSSNNPFTLHYIFNGAYSLVLSAHDTNGSCSSIVIDSVVITSGVNCNFSAIASFTTSFGSNGLVNFTNTSSGMFPGTVPSWDFGYQSTSNQFSPSHTFQYNGTYYPSLTMADSTGQCVFWMGDTIVITNASPCAPLQAAFTYSYGANGDITFHNTTTGADTATFFVWDFGNGVSVLQNDSVFTINSPNGTFPIYMKSINKHNPCSSSVVDTINVTNSCVPVVYFWPERDTTQIGAWNMIANYSSNITSVIWHWGDGTSSSGFSPSHTYSSAGWYNVCATVISTCGDSALRCENDSLYRGSSMITVSVKNANATGFANHAVPNVAINLFPNPTLNGEFSITNVKASDVIRITNVYGQEINVEIKKENGLALARIETAGAYFVTINSKGRITTLKVITGKE